MGIDVGLHHSAFVIRQLVSGGTPPVEATVGQLLAHRHARTLQCAGHRRDGQLEAFGGRCLNTHPALLPSFPGTHGVRDALAHGVRVAGCTVFLVDDGVDAGPIVAQATVPVADDDDEATLHERIKVAERALLAATVGAMARDGRSVRGRKVRVGPCLERS